MNHDIAPGPAVVGLRAALDGVRADVNDLLERRASLMATTCAELAAHGVEALVVEKRAYLQPPEIGARVRVLDEYSTFAQRTRFERRFDDRVSVFPVGPWWTGESLIIDRGTFEVLIVDGDDCLLAKLPDVDDIERGHRLAVARLRTLASKDGIRVCRRDHALTLVDAMDAVIHEGTVETAYFWLLNIDVEAVERW